jgi:hypothetical protein
VYGRPPSWEEKERRWQAERTKREAIEAEREGRRGEEAEKVKAKEEVLAYQEDKRARLQAAAKRGKDLAYKKNRQSWKNFKARAAAKERRRHKPVEVVEVKVKKKAPAPFRMSDEVRAKMKRVVRRISLAAMFEGVQWEAHRKGDTVLARMQVLVYTIHHTPYSVHHTHYTHYTTGGDARRVYE